MLSWFRKHASSRTAKALYVFLAITFFGGFGILSNRYLGSRPVEESSEPVAVVNGEEISARDFFQSYQRALRFWYEQMNQLYGKVPEELLDKDALKQEVLDQMIEQKLLLQEAKKLGIKVTKGEVNAQISGIEFFQDQSGKFSPELYQRILSQYNITPEQFERDIYNQLLINRLLALITAPVSVSEDELKTYYQKAQEEINLAYFFIDAEKRYSKLEPGEEEIKQYYEQHKKEFDWPEVRKIRYLKFHIPDFEKKVKMSEKELKEYYEKAKDRYLIEPEKAHLRHILIAVSKDAPKEQVEKARKQAEEIAQELQAGADFAQLAEKYSQDPQTATRGGDLGWWSPGQLIPEFDKTAFSLPVGSISEPVRTRFGFHIIKLEEYQPAKYKSFDEVKDQVKEELSRNKAHQIALEFTRKVAKDCQGLGMEACAEKYHLTLKESEWFKKREFGLEGIPDSMDITEEAFYLNQGEVSEVISGLDDLYIIEVIGIQDPHQATLEEAMPKILRRLRPEVRLRKAKEDMRALLKKVKKGWSMRWASRQVGAELKKTGLFKRGDKIIPGIGYSEEISRVIFRLSKDNPYPDDVYDLEGKVYLFKLIDQKPPDLSKFEEEKEQVKTQLLVAKKQEVIEKYLEELKKAQIEIKTEILKKFD